MGLIKAGVLIEKEGKYLLVQEKASRVLGKWNIPSGTVEGGESVSEAAAREVKEETGLEVEVDQLFMIATNTFSDTKELHIFQGTITKANIVPSAEILNVKWFSKEELKVMKENLVGTWIIDVIEKA